MIQRYWIDRNDADVPHKSDDGEMVLYGDHVGAILFAMILAEVSKAAAWALITPETLPKMGDELGSWFDDPSFFVVCDAGGISPYEDLVRDGWTHFRHINPPAPDGSSHD